MYVGVAYNLTTPKTPQEMCLGRFSYQSMKTAPKIPIRSGDTGGATLHFPRCLRYKYRAAVRWLKADTEHKLVSGVAGNVLR